MEWHERRLIKQKNRLPCSFILPLLLTTEAFSSISIDDDDDDDSNI